VPIIINVVSSNPVFGEVYTKHYYVCSDKVFQWQKSKDTQYNAAGRSFSPVFSTNKTERHDIADILLKVALNTITLI